MAYLRWSHSPWYVFDHVTKNPGADPICAIWPSKQFDVYKEDDVRDLVWALNQWLEENSSDG